MPGFIAASVWMKSSTVFTFRLLRPFAPTIPLVTEPVRPNGAPNAQHAVADVDGVAVSDSRKGSGSFTSFGSSFTSAMSDFGSWRMSLVSELAAVVQCDIDGIEFATDVIVREDDAARVDEDAGAVTGVGVFAGGAFRPPFAFDEYDAGLNVLHNRRNRLPLTSGHCRDCARLQLGFRCGFRRGRLANELLRGEASAK